MAVSSAFAVLLLSLVLCTQALEQQPVRGRRSRRDITASMASFFSSLDKRLAALEARWDNGTEGRLAARLEAKVEGVMQDNLQDVEEKQQDVEEKLQDVEEKLLDVEEKLQDVEVKLQGVQNGMQRLESMFSEILSSKMKAMEEKVAELLDSKSNANEERLASMEASKTKASPAQQKNQSLHQYGTEAPHSSADLRRVAKLEAELTRLQEKVSALDKRLQDNDLGVGSLHNVSVLAMEGVVHSVIELVAASEQSLKSTMENITKFVYENTASMMNGTILASIMNDTKAQLARAEENTALLNASIDRLEQSTKNMATCTPAVEDKLNNATSLHAEEAENTRATCEDMLRWREDFKNHTAELSTPLQYRRTCQDYYDNGQRTSGVYTLLIQAGQSPMEVYCEMSNGSGWVVFQRRQDGSEDFYRNWQNYEDGFGDIYGEFWLGNRNIHRLTSAGLTQLRVDLQAWSGSTAFASYSHFSVGDANSSYRLSVTGYSGTAGDSLEYHHGHKFSTLDQDNDVRSSGNCAQQRKGAWWYVNCAMSNLNGGYGSMDTSGWQYVMWNHWLGTHALLRTELKLK